MASFRIIPMDESTLLVDTTMSLSQGQDQQHMDREFGQPCANLVFPFTDDGFGFANVRSIRIPFFLDAYLLKAV